MTTEQVNTQRLSLLSHYRCSCDQRAAIVLGGKGIGIELRYKDFAQNLERPLVRPVA